MPSRYIVLSEVQRELPALPDAHTFLRREAGTAEAATALQNVATLLTKVARDHTQPFAWESVVAATSTSKLLRATILGMSTTAGCGALTVMGRDGIAMCNIAHSWSRHWHDAVASALSDWAGLDTVVHFKNAVAPSYFGECTSTFIDPASNIVLLEWAPNAWISVQAATRSVTAIRRAAPHALLVFVNWLQYGFKDQTTGRLLATLAAEQNASSVTIDLRRTAMDKVLEVDAGEIVSFGRMDPAAIDVLKIERRRSNAPPFCMQNSTSNDRFWRLHCTTTAAFSDAVHPSALGHWFIGTVAASFVSGRLLEAHARTQQQPRNHLPDRDAGVETSGATTPEQPGNERCFPRADLLPVHRTWNPKGEATWKLVDEGSALKGVAKLGLLSRTPGDALELALPQMHANASCGGVLVSLGFLCNPHKSQGLLKISCTGCVCGPHGKLFGNQILYKFPTLDTSVQGQHAQGLDGNISVTATSYFLAGVTTGAQCLVRLEHVAGRGFRNAKATPSRVRLDSLYVRRSSPWDERSLGDMKRASEYVKWRQGCPSGPR